MARTFLSSGQTQGIAPGSEATELFGTNGNETVNVLAGADVIFDASFNRGGDVITIAGNAASYTATIVGGSRLVLTGTNGSVLDIPVGGVGVTINFGDAANRTLKFDTAGNMLLGNQTIAAVGPTTVQEGTGGGGQDPDPEPTDGIYLTSGNDNLTGTSGNDQFFAYLSQNPNVGGVSNTLSSGDIVRGGAGQDSLFAQLVPEFVGGGATATIDVQPIINSVERIEFEVRDRDYGSNGGSVSTFASYGSNQNVYVDAKYITGHVRIGSKQSDGDLVIENLTTLANNGTTARNTEDITITMDHTDNFNSDGDASDLFVFFDDDYLLAGQSRTTSQANYWLLDEDSPDYVNEPLANIERNGVSLTIDGTPITIEITQTIANIPDTWEGYAAALQTRINQMISAGTTILQGVTVVVDWNNTDQTYNDFGNLVTIPAITLIDANGRELVPTGYLIPEGASGSFDIFGRFNNVPSEALDNPITVNIELNKVGRAGDGGDLIVGGKAGDKGIEVFNVSVLGGADKPSSLGTLASTGHALAEVYIKTDASAVGLATHASLEIRDGFGDDYYGSNTPPVAGGSSSVEPADMRLVDADDFLGDLLLGTHQRIVNLDTLTAQGGGNVTFRGELNGDEVNQPYSYTTGAGNDYIDLDIDGDAVDFAQSSVSVSTGDGDDEVIIGTSLWPNNANDTVNQAILRNIEVDTGAGNDMVKLAVGARGTSVINTGAGDDVIYTDGSNPWGESGQREVATWAFNFDGANPPTGTTDLQGVQTSLRYIGENAKLRVVLSGAGSAAGESDHGGGVMALDDAVWKQNGYEVEVSIGKLIGGNKYFGDQRDINAALLKAINEDPLLNKLLVAEVTENNTVVVRSITAGEFKQDDLEVTIVPQAYTSAAYAGQVLGEARALSHNSGLTLDDLWGAGAVAGTAYGTGANAYLPLGNAAAQDAWYQGLGVDNAYQLWSGEASNRETDNIINGGAGNDLLVLSTDAVDYAAQGPYTISSHTALLNGASNETIVVGETGAKAFGNDTVMNFETATVTGQGNGNFNAGLDFLDFSVYLTSKEDQSVNSSSAPDNDVSNTLIPVTLEVDVAANPSVTADANEVLIVQFVAASGQGWSGLSNAVIQTLFNSDGSLPAHNFGNLQAANFWANDEYAENPGNGTDDLIGGAGNAKAILMVENAANLGEYKVFELSWNGNASADADGNLNGVVTATLQGSLDFGTSLNGIHEGNLVGSNTYNTLIDQGIYNTTFA